MDSAPLLHQMIIEQGDRIPEAPAILAPGKRALSFGELAHHILRTALQFSHWGIRPGSRLAVVLPNGPEMATAFLAIMAVSTCAPLNPAYLEEEFKFSFKDLRIDMLVILQGIDHPARRAAAELGIPVIELYPDAHTAGLFKLTTNRPDDDGVTQPILAGAEDIGLVLHTSGTTSRPKIVPLTQSNLSCSVKNIAGTYDLTPADRCLNMMPLFHIHGLMGVVAASLVSGASVVCVPAFVPDQVLDWLAGFKVTWYSAVPPIHQAVFEQARSNPESTKKAHLRFIRSCSSALPPQIAQEMEALFHAPVLEAYGMTEAAHQIASNPLPPHPHKFGSVGMPTGATRVTTLDELGMQLHPHMVGEICIRGENVMTGYENNPTTNAACFTDSWLRTGDLGYLDEDGYLFIQGRLKEQINRGGEKISPREIDEVLLQHAVVRQAVAFAVSHPSLGEDVAAAVVLQPGKTVSMRELRQFAAARLAEHKVPRLIVFLPEIPRGATGKIQRIGLADRLKAELEAARAEVSTGYDPPQNSTEVKILSIWQQVLGQQEIGAGDDLIALGVNSIEAAHALVLINEYFNTHLSIRDIFDAPTTTLLGELVKEKQNILLRS